MEIRVHLFSILKDCLPAGANRGQATITLPEDATLGDLIVHLGIDKYLGFSPAGVIDQAGWQVSVSGQFGATADRVLHNGDTVLMMPHASGGD
jgi:molybdopterin converting factor small subunit